MGGCDRAVDLPAGVFCAHFQHVARLGSPSLVLNESARSCNGVKHQIAHISPLMTLLLFVGCRGNFNQHRDNSLSVLLGVISSFVCKCRCSIPHGSGFQHMRLHSPLAQAASLPSSRPLPAMWVSGVRAGQVVLNTRIKPELFPSCLCCHWERDL